MFDARILSQRCQDFSQPYRPTVRVYRTMYIQLIDVSTCNNIIAIVIDSFSFTILYHQSPHLTPYRPHIPLSLSGSRKHRSDSNAVDIPHRCARCNLLYVYTPSNGSATKQDRNPYVIEGYSKRALNV